MSVSLVALRNQFYLGCSSYFETLDPLSTASPSEAFIYKIRASLASNNLKTSVSTLKAFQNSSCFNQEQDQDIASILEIVIELARGTVSPNDANETIQVYAFTTAIASYLGGLVAWHSGDYDGCLNLCLAYPRDLEWYGIGVYIVSF